MNFEPCKRNFDLDKIIEGLKQGKTLCVDRSDAPELQDLLELEKQGLVTSEMTSADVQCSVLKFRWKQ